MQVDSLPAEPQGKPKNIGVGSLSLLQRIFPGIELGSPALQVDSLPAELLGKPRTDSDAMQTSETSGVCQDCSRG